MTLPIRFRPEAEEDLRLAIEWYEEQREGLGDELTGRRRRDDRAVARRETELKDDGQSVILELRDQACSLRAGGHSI